MQVISSTYQTIPTCSDNLTAEGITRTASACFCLDLEPLIEGEQPLGPVEMKAQAETVGPFPLPGLGAFYQFGNEFDFSIYVIGRGPVEISEKNCNRATVCVDYGVLTNSLGGNPNEPPTAIPKTVGIEFIEENRPGERFKFEGFCDEDGTPIVQLDDDGQPIPNSEGEFIELDPLVIEPGDIGPIRNSAGCVIKRNCLEYRHILRVRTYVEQFDCDWGKGGSQGGPLGQWNLKATRIVEQDDVSVTFDCWYPPCTLQLLNIGKSLVMFEGRNYVCLDWVLSYDPDGYFIKQLDAGTQAAFVAGAQDVAILDSAGNPGGTISADDERLIRNKTGKRDLGVSSPILLNGEGAEWCLPNSIGAPTPIYLAYTKEDSKFDFDLLPICG